MNPFLSLNLSIFFPSFLFAYMIAMLFVNCNCKLRSKIKRGTSCIIIQQLVARFHRKTLRQRASVWRPWPTDSIINPRHCSKPIGFVCRSSIGTEELSPVVTVANKKKQTQTALNSRAVCFYVKGSLIVWKTLEKCIELPPHDRYTFLENRIDGGGQLQDNCGIKIIMREGRIHYA